MKKQIVRIFYVSMMMLVLSVPAKTQNSRLNFGLQQPQDPATLPVSKVLPQKPVRKSTDSVVPALEKVNANEFRIVSGWKMTEAEQVTASATSIFSEGYITNDWYNATVPGTVLTTLIDQGVYPDPWFGLNNMQIPDSLCRKDWWYRIELPLPDNQAGKNLWLLFNGINYRADIWMNGRLLGTMAGAFARGNFNATAF
jgi:hypothetical protein